MEKEKGIAPQLSHHRRNDGTGTRESCGRMADHALCLSSLGSKPVVDEGEALAAVVVLPVLDAHRLPVPKDGAVLAETIQRSSLQLAEVDRGVRVMVHPEQ